MFNRKIIMTGILICTFFAGGLFASESNQLEPLTSKIELLDKICKVKPQTTVNMYHTFPELEIICGIVPGEVFIRGGRAYAVICMIDTYPTWDNKNKPMSYDGSFSSQKQLFNSRERLGSSLGFDIYFIESTDINRILSQNCQKRQKINNTSRIKEFSIKD